MKNGFGFLPGVTTIYRPATDGSSEPEVDQWAVYINPAHIVSMRHGPDSSMILTMTDGSEHSTALQDAHDWGLLYPDQK